MKIELNIPDWVEQEKGGIWILAGIECAAYKLPWEDFWNIKISRCSGCGRCCKKINCPDLNEQNMCGLAGKRPFLCCTSDPKNIKECTSKYKKVYK